MRAKTLVADNQTERSFRDFSQAIEMRPNDPQPLIDARRGVYRIERIIQAAIGDANAALALGYQPGLGVQPSRFGGSLHGNLQGALADFDRAVNLTPDESNYFERGTTYQMLGEQDKAIADFTEVIAFRPATAAAYFARAKSKRAIGDLRGAEQDHLTGRIIDGR